MTTGPIIAEIAALVGEPARATMLSALLDGRALTAHELAFAARVTPQTASTHLAKLTEAGLLRPLRQGRHRYFRLASPKVVDLLDAIVAIALENRPRYRPLSHNAHFHVEDAILEPKPVQKPHPPVLIAGGGEQMTLRAVARLADACNLVRSDIAEARNKLAVLRSHCDAVGRDYTTIEKTHVQGWLLARNDAALTAKREQVAVHGPLPSFVGTVSTAIDLIGQYRDAGIDLLIYSDPRNDVETRELFASDVMPHFA